MATNQKPATNAMSTKSPSMSRLRPANVRMIQNFHLVWLDGSMDEINNDDCCNCITKLRQVVNNVNTFIDVDQCIDFITDTKAEKTFMMVSEALSKIIAPIVQDIPQVSSIYIFSGNEDRHETWAEEWPKVKGIFTDIIPICEILKQAVKDCDHNVLSISFIKSTDGTSNPNLDTLDSSFMYTQILKEILLSIDFKQEHINEFLTHYQEQLGGNTIELSNVEKLRKEYRDHQPIWWYTYNCFLYSMLNRALRMMEVDFIIKMGFFVRDLHNHIVLLHAEQYGRQNHLDPFIVFRGQGLLQMDFNQLMKTKGGLMSFNNFLSTSLDRVVSLAFAESNQNDPDLIGILFEITINPSISSSTFANIENVSYFKGEEEILFSMHSVFRIGQVKQIDKNNRLWQVDLTLTDDNDPQLQALTEQMREETREWTGWFRLGQLMIKLGQFNKAEELYEILLQQTTNEGEKEHLFYHLGWANLCLGKYHEAIGFLEKALQIGQKTHPATHPNLATCYNNIGGVCTSMGEYSKALSYYEKVVEIYQKTLPANHPHLATSYNNIGKVYYNMGEYSKALSYYENAFEIWYKTLPANHPDLATSYNNIGEVCISMGEYLKALSYYEKVIEICHKALPPNHPSLATSYNNSGSVYYNMGEYSKALSYYEKAVEIYQKTLPANHPDLATSYNNIGAVYDNMDKYSKALSYYENAFEIWHTTLSANHPLLATSYNNIGGVYKKMGEYSKALSYYENAFEIYQKPHPANHPHLATSYNNIGNVCISMGEYSKAISYFEKAVEIYQKTLPANHPDLATSYNSIGLVYYNMGEYSKALSYYEKDLEISQKTLPANHPDLATSYNNIGEVCRNMGEYSKARLYFEKDLEISQKALPANHPRLATSYNNIGAVYDDMGEYLKALLYFERALNIFQSSLVPNHPSIKTVKESIEIVKKKM
jgi:tetratricopeptide (TPR) repeat protein